MFAALLLTASAAPVPTHLFGPEPAPPPREVRYPSPGRRYTYRPPTPGGVADVVVYHLAAPSAPGRAGDVAVEDAARRVWVRADLGWESHGCGGAWWAQTPAGAAFAAARLPASGWLDNPARSRDLARTAVAAGLRVVEFDPWPDHDPAPARPSTP